eukprot:Sspe_Gene.25768::Locus_10442_Transcript_1_1_Confidence_1.000_Length_3124::g.25768::m.25768
MMAGRDKVETMSMSSRGTGVRQRVLDATPLSTLQQLWRRVRTLASEAEVVSGALDGTIRQLACTAKEDSQIHLKAFQAEGGLSFFEPCIRVVAARAAASFSVVGRGVELATSLLGALVQCPPLRDMAMHFGGDLPLDRVVMNVLDSEAEEQSGYLDDVACLSVVLLSDGIPPAVRSAVHGGLSTEGYLPVRRMLAMHPTSETTWGIVQRCTKHTASVRQLLHAMADTFEFGLRHCYPLVHSSLINLARTQHGASALALSPVVLSALAARGGVPALEVLELVARHEPNNPLATSLSLSTLESTPLPPPEGDGMAVLLSVLILVSNTTLLPIATLQHVYALAAKAAAYFANTTIRGLCSLTEAALLHLLVEVGDVNRVLPGLLWSLKRAFPPLRHAQYTRGTPTPPLPLRVLIGDSLDPDPDSLAYFSCHAALTLLLPPAKAVLAKEENPFSTVPSPFSDDSLPLFVLSDLAALSYYPVISEKAKRLVDTIDEINRRKQLKEKMTRRVQRGFRAYTARRGVELAYFHRLAVRAAIKVQTKYRMVRAHRFYQGLLQQRASLIEDERNRRDTIMEEAGRESYAFRDYEESLARLLPARLLRHEAHSRRFVVSAWAVNHSEAWCRTVLEAEETVARALFAEGRLWPGGHAIVSASPAEQGAARAYRLLVQQEDQARRSLHRDFCNGTRSVMLGEAHKRVLREIFRSAVLGHKPIVEQEAVEWRELQAVHARARVDEKIRRAVSAEARIREGLMEGERRLWAMLERREAESLEEASRVEVERLWVSDLRSALKAWNASMCSAPAAIAAAATAAACTAATQEEATVTVTDVTPLSTPPTFLTTPRGAVHCRLAALSTPVLTDSAIGSPATSFYTPLTSDTHDEFEPAELACVSAALVVIREGGTAITNSLHELAWAVLQAQSSPAAIKFHAGRIRPSSAKKTKTHLLPSLSGGSSGHLPQKGNSSSSSSTAERSGRRDNTDTSLCQKPPAAARRRGPLSRFTAS